MGIVLVQPGRAVTDKTRVGLPRLPRALPSLSAHLLSFILNTRDVDSLPSFNHRDFASLANNQPQGFDRDNDWQLLSVWAPHASIRISDANTASRILVAPNAATIGVFRRNGYVDKRVFQMVA
jgi:hypothetical protein